MDINNWMDIKIADLPETRPLETAFFDMCLAILRGERTDVGDPSRQYLDKQKKKAKKLDTGKGNH